MEQALDILISFAPVMIFLIAMIAYVYTTKSIRYPALITLTALGSLLNIAEAVFIIGTTAAIITVLAQAVIATLVFFGLIYLGGDKTSADTIFTIVGVIATIPLWGGLWTPILGLVFLAIGLTRNLIKQMGGKQAMETITSEAMASQMNGSPLPDFSTLPDRNTIEAHEKRMTTSPFFLAASLLNAAILIAFAIM